MGVHDLQTGRLGDDGEVRPQALLHQLLDAEKRVLLVHGAGQDHVGRARRLLADEPGERGQHGGHPALHVARPAAVELAVADLAAERVDRHPVHRHRVLVDFEQNRRAAPRRLVPGDDVVAQRGDRSALVRHAEVAEEPFQVVGDAVLVELVAR